MFFLGGGGGGDIFHTGNSWLCYLQCFGDEGSYLWDKDDGLWWPTFGGWYTQGDFDKMEEKWRKRGEEVQVQDAIWLEF